MAFKILAIKGYAGAGKTTVEKTLQWLMSVDNDMSAFNDKVKSQLLNNKLIRYASPAKPMHVMYRSFADPLKDFLASLMDCHPDDLREQDVKESLQPDLFGDLIVRDMHLKIADAIKQCTGNEDIFADSMKRTIVRLKHEYRRQRAIQLYKNALFIIDDLRYPFEHEMLQHLVLEGVADDYVCLEVKKPNTKSIQHNSESEQSKIVPDFVYVNNYDLQNDLYQLQPIVCRLFTGLD